MGFRASEGEYSIANKFKVESGLWNFEAKCPHAHTSHRTLLLPTRRLDLCAVVTGAAGHSNHRAIPKARQAAPAWLWSRPCSTAPPFSVDSCALSQLPTHRKHAGPCLLQQKVSPEQKVSAPESSRESGFWLRRISKWHDQAPGWAAGPAPRSRCRKG